MTKKRYNRNRLYLFFISLYLFSLADGLHDIFPVVGLRFHIWIEHIGTVIQLHFV